MLESYAGCYWALLRRTWNLKGKHPHVSELYRGNKQGPQTGYFWILSIL